MYIHPAVIIVPGVLLIVFILTQMYYGRKEEKAMRKKLDKGPKAYRARLQKEAELDYLLDEHEMSTYHNN